MRPSDAELKSLLSWEASVDASEDSYGLELTMTQAQTAINLAKAELQRRAAPASVPAELVDLALAAIAGAESESVARRLLALHMNKAAAWARGE